MNWLYYLAEANLYLGVFYLAYCLLLNRDTHYQMGRAYLVLSCIAAFILPVLQVGALKPVEQATPVHAVNYTLPPIAAPPVVVRQGVQVIEKVPVKVINTMQPVNHNRLSLQDWIWYAYLTGAAILLILLFIKLYVLLKLMGNKQSVKNGKYKVVYLPGSDVAFSFFNYLFIGTDAPGANTIITHELVHIRQKHSADIIFLELLKIVNWFNPCVYLLQNSLKTVHEYIADEQTAAYQTDALTYASFLLDNAYGAGGPTIAHSFFNYNLLKKRIIMLNQQRSGNLARLKYLVAAPICAVLLCASTLVFSKTYGWVDLAPAKAHTAKHKLLKITKNGVTTLSDKLSINQKSKNVVYTPGTITKADESLLAKNQHIKVEVVEDSTSYTTKDGRLILPVVNVDGYYLMDHFLHHNIHYATAKGDKGGLVEVEFTLDKDRHITGAKVVKSGGDKLDALALNGFTAYKGIVNDDPGKTLKIGVYFFTDDYSIFKTDSLGKDPEFGGELIITNYKYPAKVTVKGYEYDESGTGFPGNDNNTSYARVIIYDKNGDGTWYYESKCSPADLQMLKDKYGYTFPSASSLIVQQMKPKIVNNKRLGYIFDATSYLDAPYSNKFYNYIMDTIKYPIQAQKALKGGVVVLNFNLDNNGVINNVTVAHGAGNGFDEAAVKALQAYKTSIKDNAGTHSIAVVFCVAEKQYRPIVSEKVKKDGYVGELAVSDVKSPFVYGSVNYTPPAAAPSGGKTGGN